MNNKNSKIFFRFGKKKNKFIIGLYHNNNDNIEIINFLLKNYKFKKYFLELNIDNRNFILRNNFKFSEYYTILNKFKFKEKEKEKEIEKEKASLKKNNNYNNNNAIELNLMDISLEKEIEIFHKIKLGKNIEKTNQIINNNINNNNNNINFDIFDSLISFKFSKFIFYKIFNYNFEEIIYNNNINNNNEYSFIEKNLKNFDFFKSHILFREFYFLYKFNIDDYEGDINNIIKDNKNYENYKIYFGKDNLNLFINEIKKENINNGNDNINNNNKNIIISNDIKDKDNQILIIVGKKHFENFINYKLI
jgi:hypothetical protein